MPQNISIIDTASLLTPYKLELRGMGVQTVIRYYEIQDSEQLPNKLLTKEEAQEWSEAGFNLATVYEDTSLNPTISEFSSERAERAANRALELAGEIGQPEGSAIYFAVDFDFDTSSQVAAIVSYFEKIKGIFDASGRHYKMGSYCSGGIARKLLTEGIVEFTWLPGSLGWLDSRDFKKSMDWTLFQSHDDIPFHDGDYDGNLLNPTAITFGEWNLEQRDAPPEPAHPDAGHDSSGPGSPVINHSGSTPADHQAAHRACHEVIARNGFHLRSGPSAQFEASESVAHGAHVFVLQTSGDWSMVDLRGDGAADGYILTQYLQPLADTGPNEPSGGGGNVPPSAPEMFKIEIDGHDVVVRDVTVTAFGGGYDKGDDGKTASGVPNDGSDPYLLGCALPVESAPGTRHSPLVNPDKPPVHIPWGTVVKFWKGDDESTAIKTKLIDNGPNVAHYPDHAADLTVFAASKFNHQLSIEEMANRFEDKLSYRIVGGAQFVRKTTS